MGFALSFGYIAVTIRRCLPSSSHLGVGFNAATGHALPPSSMSSYFYWVFGYDLLGFPCLNSSFLFFFTSLLLIDSGLR